MLSGLSSAAGVVLAPKSEGYNLKHIEFVPLGHGRALVILVSAEGQVENRVIDIPLGLPPSALQQASNYLNARLSGRPLQELRRIVATRWRRTAPNSTTSRPRWWRRGSRPGPGRGGAAA